MPSALIAKIRAAPADVSSVLVFLICLALNALVHRASAFPDPDAFYHIKMAQLIGQQGLVRDFSWLPYTTLAHAFADQHLLYHLLLIPFIQLYGVQVGATAATVVFASLAMGAFYGALRVHQARWPLLFTLVLATSYSFMVRVNLTKAGALSVTVVMLCLAAYRLKRPLWLFVLSWAFVLLHAGWPLMIAIVAAYMVAGPLVDGLRSGRPSASVADSGREAEPETTEPTLGEWLRQDEMRLGFAALGGLACGLIFNPYFPVNLRFYWEQIFHIAVLGYGNRIAVGLEWYPYSLGDFVLRNTALINAFVFCGVLAFLVWRGGPSIRRQSAPADRADALALTASLLFTIVLAVLTARSRRHIEYLAPVGMFSAALLATWLMARLEVGALRERLRRMLPAAVARWLPMDTAIAVTLLAIALFYSVITVVSVTDFYSRGMPLRSLERASTWLKENTTPNSIIVNSDFAQFGSLFYWNDRNRYICGLDPTFFARQDPGRYRLWLQLITDKMPAAGMIAPLLRDDLGSRYLLVGAGEAEVRRAAEEDGGLAKVYEDSEAVIFEVR